MRLGEDGCGSRCDVGAILARSPWRSHTHTRTTLPQRMHITIRDRLGSCHPLRHCLRQGGEQVCHAVLVIVLVVEQVVAKQVAVIVRVVLLSR